MKIGFTGTRHGLTDSQRAALGTLIVFDIESKPVQFHHGACKGADAEAAALVRHIDPDSFIVAHPGKSAAGDDNEWLDDDSLEASDEVRDASTHFARNRDIVDETEMLIGCPGVGTWQSRGGTFYTMDYARKKNKPVKVIWPDGRIENR